MTERDQRIYDLEQRLREIVLEQSQHSVVIESIRRELELLKSTEEFSKQEVDTSLRDQRSGSHQEVENISEVDTHLPFEEKIVRNEQKPSPSPTSPKKSSDIERYIGENLLSLVGILIIICGAAIGGKYAIEHDLISPLVRVILGYILGGVLLVTSFYLRKKYEKYSAILAGGAMAVCYLITFSAYNYYQLFNQPTAFVLMVFITAFTVYQALSYNIQVLAQIGLVGAYAVPFLLSDNSGRVVVLFSYIAMINSGILIVAFRKDWRLLFHSSFFVTWLIFGGWIVANSSNSKLEIGLIFFAIFGLIFYFTFLSGVIFRQRILSAFEHISIFLNAFFVFFFGIVFLDMHSSSEKMLGIFSLVVAAVHLIAYFTVAQRVNMRNTERLLFGLFTAMLIVAFAYLFKAPGVTFAIVLLGFLYFILGKTSNRIPFLFFAQPLLMLGFVFLIGDWLEVYQRAMDVQSAQTLHPFVNVYSIVTFFTLAVIGFVWNSENKRNVEDRSELFCFPTNTRQALWSQMLLVLAYFSFRMEIEVHWRRMYSLLSELWINEFSLQNVPYANFNELKTIWVINYSLLFFSAITFMNVFRMKDHKVGKVALGGVLLSFLALLTQGLFAFAYLTNNYFSEHFSDVWNQMPTIRIISYSVFLLAVAATWKNVRQEYFSRTAQKMFDCVLHFSILALLTYEVISMLSQFEDGRAYRRGLSILWGSYAVLLIVFGLWKKMKHLRVFAIILFGVTLIKLFFFDLDHLSALARSGLFIVMGLFLLGVSYLYLRNRKKMENEL